MPLMSPQHVGLPPTTAIQWSRCFANCMHLGGPWRPGYTTSSGLDRFQTHSNGSACNLRDRRPSLTNSSPFDLRVSSAPIPASIQTRLLATQSPTPAAPILNLPALTLRNPKHTDKLPCRQPPRRRSIVKRTFYSDVKLRVMCVKARTVAIARET